jgi:hypothetical protein
MVYTKPAGLLDGGEVSLLVGGRESIGCDWWGVKGASHELYDDDDDDVMTANILNAFQFPYNMCNLNIIFFSQLLLDSIKSLQSFQ